MHFEKLSILELDHYDKYKVFKTTHCKSQTIGRVAGMGHELPLEHLRKMSVGQEYIHGKELARYTEDYVIYERLV